MAFFNEFPFTRTYDSDLAWLIRRMKEVLARMDSVEERMAALERLVADFIASLNIEQAIKDALIIMVEEGVFNELLTQLFNDYTTTINQRIDAQDQRLNAQDLLIQQAVANLTQRVDALANSLANYYTKTEIDEMLGSVENLVTSIVLGNLYSYKYIDVLNTSIYSDRNTLPIKQDSANTTRLALISGQLYVGNGYMTFNTTGTRHAFELVNNTSTIYRTNPDTSGTSGLTMFLSRMALDAAIEPWGIKLGTFSNVNNTTSAPQAQLRTGGGSPLLTANVSYEDDIRITDPISVTGSSVTLVGANTTGHIHLMPLLLPVVGL